MMFGTYTLYRIWIPN